MLNGTDEQSSMGLELYYNVRGAEKGESSKFSLILFLIKARVVVVVQSLPDFFKDLFIYLFYYLFI